MFPKLLKNSPWIAAAFSILATELIIFTPDKWWLITLGLGVALISLTKYATRLYKIKGAFSSLILIIIPGIGFLFFIEIPIWQHLVGLALGVVVFNYFYRLIKIITNNDFSNNITLPLANIFFATGLSLGLEIIFQFSLLGSLGVLLILTFLFPQGLSFEKKPPKSLAKSIILKLPITAGLSRQVDFWFTRSLKHNELNELIPLAIIKWLALKSYLQVNKFRLLLSLVLVEAFVVVSALPSNILVGSSIITIVIFSIFYLINLHYMGLFKKTLAFRYIGFSLLFIFVIIISARWS